MKFLASATALLAAAVSAVQAVSVSGPRLLAVFDDLADKDTYSTFLGDLEGMRCLALLLASASLFNTC